MNASQPVTVPAEPRGSVLEVFVAFMRLGLTSFGGPIAHLGYFHTEFVLRRGWLSEERYSELLTLAQFLPGPASSQLGFALGLLRAGWGGALAAFVAFTLPALLLLIAFAYLEPSLSGASSQAALHGLKLVAICVVAHAVVGMARALTPDAPRWILAAASAATVLIIDTAWAQLVVIALGALAGPLIRRKPTVRPAVPLALSYGTRLASLFLVVFAALLVASLSLPAQVSPLASMAAGFYRAGALVFGGGHVVLPLLEQTVVRTGWISTEEFLTGYGAAQAVPGPMFSLSAYLGARIAGIAGALACVIGMFLPGFLIIAGTLPYWSALTSNRAAGSMLAGVNAAVVGILAAALYDPVIVAGVESIADIVIAVAGFAMLMSGRVATVAVIAWCVAASMVNGR